MSTTFARSIHVSHTGVARFRVGACCDVDARGDSMSFCVHSFARRVSTLRDGSDCAPEHTTRRTD